MTSNFSCAEAFSTLHSSTIWRIDTIIFTTLKKPSSLSSPPPPPTNVLEINKPPGGGLHRLLLDQISIERFHKVHPIKIRDWGNQTGETLKSSNVAILAASKLAARRLTKGLF